MTAREIENLLAERHSKDVFIPQCKDGPSYGGLNILDAWVLKKSWAHPLTIGYEIKVTRNDFVRDEKWHSYMDYCNEFYFACPTDIIMPAELPPSVGLLWVSKTGGMLRLKKKAQRREAKIPEHFYHYILMCRAKIVDSTFYHSTPEDARTFWKKWAEDKTADLNMGRISSRKIRELVDTKIEDVKAENKKLKAQVEDLKDIKEFCASIGFNAFNYLSTGRIKRRISEFVNGVPADFEDHIESVLLHLKKIKTSLYPEVKEGENNET